jgi:hypothetical protein
MAMIGDGDSNDDDDDVDDGDVEVVGGTVENPQPRPS